MTLFKDLGLSDNILQALDRLGFEEPTLIQKLAIPHIVEGKDVIGESATGSGKTLAFGCGVLENVVSRGGVQAIVLTPTRELAEQVKKSLKELANEKSLKVTPIYGGVSINPQIAELRKADVVVATPGRLLDHLERRTIDTSAVKLLVLDEADRMLDMGFIEDVEKIMEQCPPERQTLFFSATISPRIEDLADNFMNEPVKVTAEAMVDPTKLTQVYYEVERNMKLSVLVHFLKKEERGLVMVFCNTRRAVDMIADSLKLNNIRAIAIHGGHTQNKRNNSIEQFNKGQLGVLVCTDVAARGLHIDDVSHVYNYDIPNDPKEYVHRIGRTARAGEKGKVINLLCNYDYDNFGRVMHEFDEFDIEKKEKPKVERVQMARINRDRDDRGPSRGGSRSGGSSGSSRGGYGSGNRSGGSSGSSRGGYGGRSRSGGSSGSSRGGYGGGSRSGGSSGSSRGGYGSGNRSSGSSGSSRGGYGSGNRSGGSNR